MESVRKDPLFAEAIALLHEAKNHESQALAGLACKLAAKLVELAGQHSHPKERLLFHTLSSMLHDPIGKQMTTCLVDRLFRSKKPQHEQLVLKQLLQTYGMPRYLPDTAKFAIHLLGKLYEKLPQTASSLCKALIRFPTREIVIDEDPRAMQKHLQKRKREGIRINLNHLGEAILGEKEAENRRMAYLKDLANPNIEYISVKISTLCSQLNLIDRRQTLNQLKKQLGRLYAESLNHTYQYTDGTKQTKFINLDMEEYRDFLLTIDLFTELIQEPSFLHVRAGIVLQSYLPDTYLELKKLIQVADNRQKLGGSPIKIRLVKGANLAMETVDAALRGVEKATYSKKIEVDANFKRLLHLAIDPVKRQSIILGVGSHNIFDISYALLLRLHHDLKDFMEFEMLEGMAPQLRRVFQNLCDDMLLYCPVTSEKNFLQSVAYLIRRLDENTGPENFLHHFFDLTSGSKALKEQENLFLKSFDLLDGLTQKSNRNQNRLQESFSESTLDLSKPFRNEPDTDWCAPSATIWINEKLSQPLPKAIIPVVINGIAYTDGLDTQSFEDPSHPGEIAFTTHLGSQDLLEKCFQITVSLQHRWEELELSSRVEILHRSSALLRHMRAQLITCLRQSCGKTILEADSEVSEAIDFVEYYTRQALHLADIDGLKLSPRGLVAVIPPWNFPVAIAMGGLVSSLVCGNSVIFKPSAEGSWCGYLLCEILYKAGVPRSVLHFFPCEEEIVGNRLIQDSRLGAIVLTGSDATARHFLISYPKRHLIAETGGKNSLIMMSSCDRDLAIRDLIQSAFSYSGQKCSSASLAIVDREIYEDPHFWKQLIDGVQSLSVGSSWNLSTKIGPLITPASDKLLWALTSLEGQQSWVLKPVCDPQNPRLWTPGIVKGVERGERRHLEEFFGPILAVMCANDLNHAIELANATPYGLTSGLHSLDEKEHRFWQEKIIAGNLYINRPITGALVARQPFGGTKASRFGVSYQAGGPHTLLALMSGSESSPGTHQLCYPQRLRKLSDLLPSSEKENFASILRSYSYWYHHFSCPHEEMPLPGQENLHLHIPQENLLLRWSKTASVQHQLQTLAAFSLVNSRIEISTWQEPSDGLRSACESFVTWRVESDEAFLQSLELFPCERLRLVADVSPLFFEKVAKLGISVLAEPPNPHGRLELLNYLREVSFCTDYHRYGNLGLSSSCEPKNSV